LIGLIAAGSGQKGSYALKGALWGGGIRRCLGPRQCHGAQQRDQRHWNRFDIDPIILVVVDNELDVVAGAPTAIDLTLCGELA